MKKMILLLISLLIVVNCAVAKPRVIDLDKHRDSNASKILYDVILRDEEWTKEEAAEIYNIDRDSAKAFFVDLNDDGIKEIIGFIEKGYFYGKPGHELFILQKKNGQYKNIAEWVDVGPKYTIKILDSKTNGWHDIEAYKMYWFHFPVQETLAPLTAWKYKYYKGNYVWEAQTKDNWGYQCDVSSQPTQSIKHNQF